MHVYMLLDTDKCVLRELSCVCFGQVCLILLICFTAITDAPPRHDSIQILSSIQYLKQMVTADELNAIKQSPLSYYIIIQKPPYGLRVKKKPRKADYIQMTLLFLLSPSPFPNHNYLSVWTFSVNKALAQLFTVCE